MEETVILGGGPAGMMSAYELSKNKRECVVFERNAVVGGLARTLRYDDFLTDIGPHRFYSKREYLYEMIEDLLGNEWISVNRLSRFYVGGRFYKYPVELVDALTGVGPYRAFRMISDYYFEKAKNLILPKKPRSFQDYAIRNFGLTLAKFNILDYTEKVWGIPCSQMSPDWALQRVGGLSVYSTLKNMILKEFRSKSQPTSLIDKFYYPLYGAGYLYEKMREKIKMSGSRVITEAEVLKVSHENGRITSVTVRHKNKTTTHDCKHCISSLPITVLAKIMDPLPPKKVIDAVKKLRFRSQLYVFIELDRPNVTKDNWIYFPDKNIPFGRIYEPRNFSPKMSPEGKTSLIVEYFCFENDEMWTMPPNKLFEFTVQELEKLSFIKREEVIKCYLHKEKYVYPLYLLDYKEFDETIKEYLRSFENLHYIGRGGRFKYHAQDIALDTGFFAAKGILEGKKYDIDNIGEEQEYAEKGSIKNKRQNLD